MAPQIERNLLSYGQLIRSGCELSRVDGRRALMKNGDVFFYLNIVSEVLFVDVIHRCKERNFVGIIMVIYGHYQ